MKYLLVLTFLFTIGLGICFADIGCSTLVAQNEYISHERDVFRSALAQSKNKEQREESKKNRCRNYREIIETIYDKGSYDNAVSYLSDPTLIPDVFSGDVNGTVLPIGHLEYWKSRQYFFVLGSNVQSFDAVNVGGEVTAFFCDDNVAQSSVLIRYDYPNGSLAYYFHQIGYWRFNSNGKIYDYTVYTPNFLNYHWLWTGQNFLSDGYTENLVNIVCQVHDFACADTFPQYDNFTHCQSVLSQKLKGSPEDLWGDSALCRAFHSQFAGSSFVDVDGDPLRLKATHCKHLSEHGGGGCGLSSNYGPHYFDFVFRH